MGFGEDSAQSSAKVIEVGFFTMSHVNLIARSANIVEARAIANGAIDAMPTARPQNITKARAMVSGARTPQQLAIAVSNFILAHPSEGLGMNTGETKKPERKKKHA